MTSALVKTNADLPLQTILCIRCPRHNPIPAGESATIAAGCFMLQSRLHCRSVSRIMRSGTDSETESTIRTEAFRPRVSLLQDLSLTGPVTEIPTMRLHLHCVLLLLPASLLNAPPAAADQFRILPQQLTLSGKEASHRILVEQWNGSDYTGVAAESLQLVSDHPEIVRIEGGQLIPVADGTATIRVADGHDCSPAAVTVTNMQQPFHWSFRNHVEPVLARQGCSSGACHGALAGKGGFRISLRGYDPERDHYNITWQQQGRRIELQDPAASLLLTKPTMAVPHKGGLRLEPESRNWKILAEWIADGAVPPSDDDPKLLQLEILPDAVLLAPEVTQPLIVRAHYSDGRTEDVTHLARFSSSAEAVCTVDDSGTITVVGPGEGAVTAWFSSRIVIASVTVPWPVTDPAAEIATADSANFIDELVNLQLSRLNLQPSPPCSDEVFLRRAFLDTIGVLPTRQEVEEFLSNPAADRRDVLIDQLLERPEFVDYWTYHWADLLLLNGQELRPAAIQAWYQWIHDRVERNQPWNEFVEELVTAQGSSIENGATNFFARHQAPEDMAENVSQAFLGLSIGCARCHNHPLEKWTNDQYYAFANLFSRVRAKGWGGDSRNGDGKRTLITTGMGELIQPRTGRPRKPAPLDADPLEFDAPTSRREYLATWLTSPNNKLFARSITNRVWKNFFGTGLVEPVDDMRASNPASNERLLAAAADHLVSQKYDLKALMKVILQSAAWQRSSQTLPANAGDQRHYSRYFPRRLMAEVLLDAISDVTGVPTPFNQLLYPGGDRRATDAYPAGTRAIQLHDSAVDSWFLQTFGRNQRRITCECERSDEPSLVQVLHLSNGTTINEKLGTAENRLAKWLQQYESNDELLTEVYLTCLGRQPQPTERSEIVDVLDMAADAAERRVILEDLVWGIVSSREFLFNH